jgi:hypothetical protein
MPRIILDDTNIFEHREVPLIEIHCNILIPLASERLVRYCCLKRRDIPTLDFSAFSKKSEPISDGSSLERNQNHLYLTQQIQR